MAATTFDELCDEIDALVVDARLQRLRENEGRRRLLEAESAALLASLERDRAYNSDGHASMFGLLRSTVGWSEGECRSRTQIARLVEAHPPAGEALFEAWTSIANIASIARVFANPRCGDGVENVIGTWLNEAGRMEHGDFRQLPERWQLINDPGTRAEHANAHAARTASLSLGNTSGELSARWGALDAARNREVFDKFLEAEFEADWAATVNRYGEQATAAMMPRSAAQRAADALTAIFQRAAATPPGSKAPKPVGNVHIDWHTFCDWMIEQQFFPERHLDPFEDPTPLVTTLRSETGDGVLVDPDTIMKTLLEGFVRFVILDDHGIPIHWGRQRRLFTGAARDAVMSLSTRCTHPGCRVRTGRSQADHSQPWSDGGETRPDNGGPRCARHNRFRNHGYTVHRDHHGHWHTYRPDGTEIS